jgi:hypothetical protein
MSETGNLQLLFLPDCYLDNDRHALRHVLQTRNKPEHQSDERHSKRFFFLQSSNRSYIPIRSAMKGYTLLDDMALLKLLRLPARLTSEEAAFLLRLETHELPWLAKARILMPLGSPSPNAPKYFSSAKVLKLMQNEAELDKATKCISAGWRKRKAGSLKTVSLKTTMPAVDATQTPELA